jgi:hypothetical protein
VEARTSRFQVVRPLAFMVLAAVSCREPVDPAARSTRLSPASPTQLTGTAARRPSSFADSRRAGSWRKGTARFHLTCIRIEEYGIDYEITVQ